MKSSASGLDTLAVGAAMTLANTSRRSYRQRPLADLGPWASPDAGARPGYVLGMAVTHVFAGIPVAHRDAAVGWYERLVGRPPDLLPNDHEAAWRLTETGWIYVIVDAGRAGSALNTLLVDDLDGFLAELAKRSVEAGPVETIGSGVRVTVVTDPDGNRLQVGQPPT